MRMGTQSVPVTDRLAAERAAAGSLFGMPLKPDRSAPGVPSTLEVVAVIPTMILLGLVAGYWWKLALPTAAVIWPILLLASDTITMSQIPAAALLGLVNAAVGVTLVQGVLVVGVHGIRHRPSRARRASQV